MSRSNRQRSQLLQWARQGHIGREQLSEAMRLAGVVPAASEWRRFLDRLLLCTGLLALVIAVLFFIAFNWDGMARYTQFALVEATIVVALLAYWRLGGERLAGKLSLLAAALLLGGLLALFGQTYQTGADSWQLFASWAVLILPWVVVGRFAALWMLLLLLVNLTLLLYLQVWGGLLDALLGAGQEPLVFFLLNGVAALLWEYAALRRGWLRGRWGVRLLMLVSGVAITLMMVERMFEWRGTTYLTIFLYPLWLGLLYVVYRRRIYDLFMLAGGVLSLIVVVSGWLLRALLDWGDEGGLLVVAIVVILLSSLAVRWLRALQQEQPE